MDVAVVYKSRYGASKRYAQWIAEDLKCPVYDIREVKPGQLDNCSAVIYGCGVYASSLSGLKDAINMFKKGLVVFAVGIAKPTEESMAADKEELIPAEARDRIAFFKFRGSYDMTKMSFPHKLMIRFARMFLAKDKNATPEEREKFKGKDVDFTDRPSIKPLVDYVKRTYKGGVK